MLPPLKFWGSDDEHYLARVLEMIGVAQYFG
jgi:hypothetical protein